MQRPRFIYSGGTMSNKSFYILEIALLDQEEKAIRKIQIEASKTLYKLAEEIVKSFGFKFDHCFGFYSSFEGNITKAERLYELFVDCNESPSPGAKSVKKTKISEVFKISGDKMLFLFDYGDDWRFSVELKEIKKGENQGMKAAVIESTGKAPKQYPPCEE